MAQYANGGECETWNVGDEGVLVRISPDRGDDRWLLMAEPPLTNISHEPREVGWCGSTNNVSTTAHGWHRVCRVAGWARDGQSQTLQVTPIRA